MAWVYLFGGLAVLFVAGELLVSGSVRIAYRFKVSKLVVGLTVVSLGTSAPELFVSLLAALKGHPDIAVGNVVGSNIANIGMVIAATALLFPMTIDRNVKYVDYPVMLISTAILFILFRYVGYVDRLLGSALILLIGIHVFIMIRNSRKKTKANNEVVPISNTRFTLGILGVIIGGVGLYYGSELFLRGASDVAAKFGLTDHVVGVTLVAFGTSVPELVTSVIAAYRKFGDIAVGNILGSNVFNIHVVIGGTALVQKINLPSQMITDVYWMIAFAVVLFPAVYYLKRFNRFYGFILIAAYIYYIFSVLI